MNYVVDKVKEEQKEDVSILTHPRVITEIPLYVLRVFSSPSPPFNSLIGVTSHTNYQLAPPPSPPPKGRGVITEIPLWLIFNT